MKPLVSPGITKARVSKWILNAKALDENPTWTERRRAIEFGGHTYLVESGQVFQCMHCGHYDPEWSAIEVLEFFEQTFGIKPFEIEVTCTVSIPKENNV